MATALDGVADKLQLTDLQQKQFYRQLVELGHVVIDRKNTDVSMNVKRVLEEAISSSPCVRTSPMVYGEREFYVQLSLTNPSALTSTVTEIRLENSLST